MLIYRLSIDPTEFTCGERGHTACSTMKLLKPLRLTELAVDTLHWISFAPISLRHIVENTGENAEHVRVGFYSEWPIQNVINNRA